MKYAVEYASSNAYKPSIMRDTHSPTPEQIKRSLRTGMPKQWPVWKEEPLKSTLPVLYAAGFGTSNGKYYRLHSHDFRIQEPRGGVDYAHTISELGGRSTSLPDRSLVISEWIGPSHHHKGMPETKTLVAILPRHRRRAGELAVIGFARSVQDGVATYLDQGPTTESYESIATAASEHETAIRKARVARALSLVTPTFLDELPQDSNTYTTWLDTEFERTGYDAKPDRDEALGYIGLDDLGTQLKTHMTQMYQGGERGWRQHVGYTQLTLDILHTDHDRVLEAIEQDGYFRPVEMEIDYGRPCY
jgi:hypothetical protein